MTKEKLLTRIARLMAKAKSAEELGNAAEAAAFSAKVEELLVKNELTMSEVEYAALKEDDPIEQDFFNPKDHGIKYSRTRVAWQEQLAQVLAPAFFCKLLVIRGSNCLIFVGRKSHREVLTSIYSRMVADLERLTNAGYYEAMKTGQHRGFADAFRRGFISAIADRLREERIKREQAAASSGTSLVRLTTALAEARSWTDSNVKTTKIGGVSGRRGYNSLGREKGYEAGRSANLRDGGLGNGGSNRGQLN